MSNRAVSTSTALAFAAAAAIPAIAQTSETEIELPVTYQYDLPYPKTDGDPMVVTVRHNADGLSIAHIHAASEDTPLMSESADDFSLSSSTMFVAGPATDGRIASPEPIAGGVLVNEAPLKIEEGQRYADGEAYAPETSDAMQSWAVDNLDVSFADGDDDRTIAGLETDHRQLTVSYELTRYGRDGEVRNQETVSDTRDFWFADALPYSPLQTIPNRYDSAYFTPSGIEILDEAIEARVAEDMAGFGAVIAQSGNGPAGMSGASEVSSVEKSDPFLPETLAAIPVLPGAQADTMLGALFVTEMLKSGDRLPDGGSMSLAIGDSVSAEKGRAAWREMRNGDFGLALNPEEGSADGSVLLLMRPVNGVPEAGTYEVAGAKSFDELSEMSDAALAAHANRFQPMGMVRRDGQDHLVSGFTEGTVSIDESSDGTVSGSLDATLKLVAIDGSGKTDEVEITGEFEAVEGLEARFQSPVSRVMRD